MAATTRVFTKLDFRQAELVAEHRQLKGAHAYYTQKYDINRVPLQIELPGNLNEHSVFTVVYEYTKTYIRYEAERASIRFGSRKLYPKGSRISVSGAYWLVYSEEDGTGYVERNRHIKTPYQGLHVLQVKLEQSRIAAYLDGEQINRKGYPTKKSQEYNFLYADVKVTHPFALWETHFTTPNPTVEFDRIFGFPHNGFKLEFGSYVQFYGTWTDKPGISDKGGQLAELDTTGSVVLTLNVNAIDSTVTNGHDIASAKKLPRKHQIDLSALHCTRPSELLSITIVVGNYEK